MLEDHRIGDHAVLPTVCAQSWMIDAAALTLGINTQQYAVEIHDYRLFKGVIFDGSEPDALIIDVSEKTAPDLSVSIKVSSIKADGKPQFHYGCDVVFIDASVETSTTPVPVSIKTATTDKRCYENGSLFHSDTLQGIESFETNDQSAWLRCRLPESVVGKLSGFDVSQASSNVFANDLVYQAMLVWAREELGLGSLPSTTKQWLFLQAPSLHDAFYIHLTDVKVQGNSIKANVQMLDENNQVLARCESCEVTASDSLKDTFKRSSKAGQL